MFVRCSFVVRSFVRGAVIKAIWTFSKFSLIPLWKGFGGVTHGSLLDPEFGRFTSDKAHFSDQNEAQILEFLRKKRIRRPGSRLNAIIVSLSKANRHRRTPFGPPLPCGCNLVMEEILEWPAGSRPASAFSRNVACCLTLCMNCHNPNHPNLQQS